ncbi:tetratricopeptide repeat protein [Paragemmobacter straminiformis]|uniref:Tetratricopeptide repeat protein n=1 Tax=Paragemmobacter straminiformis TaxID=2045119 RepID=A0A842I3Y0_9RHOB|nr:tetratricopeptide repeat protein [Gemmobacter straminiformis]MBC2834376.1 tetratricopeptide repeat protein [Gemmobacter straminiformis]
MRHTALAAICLAGMALLAACQPSGKAASDRALASINEVDDENLNQIMLTVADPAEAVAYFTKVSAEKPDDPDLKRSLAKSLIRAGKPTEAATVLKAITATPAATNEDRVNLADAMIRTNDWTGAKAELDRVPPTYETYDRYRLEAMVADSQKNWKKADSFYEIASGLTTKPAGVLNNWGFSKLTRQDYAGAERLFTEALTFDANMFTAKNNLVLARGAQRKYDLPVIAMTQTERAELLYTLALTAIKQGDLTVGKGLLQDAIETHPQYFEAAERSLQALGG